MTLTVTHLVTVETGYDDHCGDYARPVCSCGWVGPTQDHTGAAANGYAHREDAAGPATGVDLLCSDLLGVMDDLAHAVSWLAETWPDDLPAPRPVGGTRDRLVELWVSGMSAAEVERAAQVMGVRAVSDPEPDSTGARYHRALRDFGRVRVEAFRRIRDDEAVAG